LRWPRSGRPAKDRSTLGAGVSSRGTLQGLFAAFATVGEPQKRRKKKSHFGVNIRVACGTNRSAALDGLISISDLAFMQSLGA
jgi:hypothetical protein